MNINIEISKTRDRFEWLKVHRKRFRLFGFDFIMELSTPDISEDEIDNDSEIHARKILDKIRGGKE